MKQYFIVAFILFGFYANAQNQHGTSLIEKQKRPKKETRAVMVELSGSNTYFSISGTTSLNDLKNIENSAKDFGIELTFVNEKFNRNQLEYVEMMIFNNNKWEVFTFGSEKLKMLPFILALHNTYSKNAVSKTLVIKNNKNNLTNFKKEEIIEII